MFETDPNIGLQGIAFRNKLIADRNARSAQSFRDAYEGWKSYALDLEGKLGDAQAEIERLKLALLVEKAHSESMKVGYFDAFRQAHPASPVLADSGKRYKSGNVKNRGRLVYEATFDRILGDARISDPTKHRAD